MSDSTYTPPRVWKWTPDNGSRFSSINRPEAGPTHEKDLPVGEHPFQLYSLATPNGVKAAVMFEELLELGIREAEYDAWLINIMEGDQFSSGFVAVNPNSKIPALLDRSVNPAIRVFESGSILLYLAEKFEQFLPEAPTARTETLNWLFWQMGSDPSWVAVSGISMPMHRRSTNTPSIATPWKSSASWMCWTGNWLRTAISPATNTPLQTWQYGPGTAHW